MIAWFLGMWGEPDFQRNMVAGFLYFVLEATVLATLVPLLVDWRREKRWEPARLDFAREMVGVMRRLTLVMKQASDEGTSQAIDEEFKKFDQTPGAMAQLAQTYSAALDPVLMSLCSQAMTEVRVMNTYFVFLKLSADKTSDVTSVVGSFEKIRGTINKMYSHAGVKSEIFKREYGDEFAQQVEKWKQIWEK